MHNLNTVINTYQDGNLSIKKVYNQVSLSTQITKHFDI